MREIPEFAAGAAFEARQHQLGAHRAVADQTAFAQGFEQRFFHHSGAITGCARAYG